MMLMALPMLLGLASCKDDNPVDPNLLASQVSGMWYNIADTEDTLTTPYGGVPYTRVIEAMLLHHDRRAHHPALRPGEYQQGVRRLLQEVGCQNSKISIISRRASILRGHSPYGA